MIRSSADTVASHDGADLLFYRLKYKNNSQTVIEEVICRRHYEELSAPGGPMAPLEGREAARLEQTVKDYTGSSPCATCAREAEQPVEAIPEAHK